MHGYVRVCATDTRGNIRSQIRHGLESVSGNSGGFLCLPSFFLVFRKQLYRDHNNRITDYTNTYQNIVSNSIAEWADDVVSAVVT